MENEFKKTSQELIEAGRFLYSRGWVPATSGNFSAKLSNGQIAITVSGRHKGKLVPEDIMLLDEAGTPLTPQRPSAETMLHVQIYEQYPEMMCVLHPHTVNATLLSRYRKNMIILQDYELLKAFPGVNTHECIVKVPVFANDQDIPRLAEKILLYIEKSRDPLYGYLIEGHGFYTWSDSVENCLKQVEAFEFLFECEMKELLYLERGALK